MPKNLTSNTYDKIDRFVKANFPKCKYKVKYTFRKYHVELEFDMNGWTAYHEVCISKFKLDRHYGVNQNGNMKKN